MEITVFTHGDSNDVNTWSNVPYFFTTTLEHCGVKVNRVNIEIEWLSRGFIAKIYNKFRQIVYHDAYGSTRTKLYRKLVACVIRKAVKQYTNADYHLFLTTSFDDIYSGKPNVLFFDWTYRIQRQRYGLQMTKDEIDYCKYEDDIINRAYAVFPMFKKSYESVKQHSVNPYVYHLNRNVVNGLNTIAEADLPSIISHRTHNILFIGRKAYINGCNILIEAYKKLKNEIPDLGLCIVGMTEDDFSKQLPDGVKCYGFLHKDIEKERETYYNLLGSCVTFCNPSTYWGGYSSTLEALYYGLPIVVTAYPDFVADFGKTIDFGAYTDGTVDNLVECLKCIIKSDNYSNICMNAHRAVKDFTWENYVDDFIKILNNIKR